MIRNQNRAGWFGASDTATIMGRWDTRTFIDWWGVKCGYGGRSWSTWPMKVGNAMEIPIIKALESLEGRIKLGRRPVYRRHRLRVNYDGLQFRRVIEIKTTKNGFEKFPRNYWMQCQVLMFATRRRRCDLFAYRLVEEDYLAPYFPEIDLTRMERFTILYDRSWIKMEYLPRLKYLAWCLKKGVWPDEDAYRRGEGPHRWI